MVTIVVASLFIIESCLWRLLRILGVIAFEEVNLEQIKKDHSHLQRLIGRGFFTPDEARTLQNRNFNSRAPENDPTLALDIFEGIILSKISNYYALMTPKSSLKMTI
ncbi:MAG: hypothetical protein ACJASL_005007 [Paraglaciecola sp.]|jgi:hypothetical protein